MILWSEVRLDQLTGNELTSNKLLARGRLQQCGPVDTISELNVELLNIYLYFKLFTSCIIRYVPPIHDTVNECKWQHVSTKHVFLPCQGHSIRALVPPLNGSTTRCTSQIPQYNTIQYLISSQFNNNSEGMNSWNAHWQQQNIQYKNHKTKVTSKASVTVVLNQLYMPSNHGCILRSGFRLATPPAN